MVEKGSLGMADVQIPDERRKSPRWSVIFFVNAVELHLKHRTGIYVTETWHLKECNMSIDRERQTERERAHPRLRALTQLISFLLTHWPRGESGPPPCPSQRPATPQTFQHLASSPSPQTVMESNHNSGTRTFRHENYEEWVTVLQSHMTFNRWVLTSHSSIGSN